MINLFGMYKYFVKWEVIELEIHHYVKRDTLSS